MLPWRYESYRNKLTLRNWVHWILDNWWDKILQSTLWETEPKSYKNIALLHFMTTFHNFALKRRVIEYILKTRNLNDKHVETWWEMFKMQTNNHNFTLWEK